MDERPRILLLHSGFCTGAEWRRTAALLAPRANVLAPTLSGSRGGPALDVRRRTLDELADGAERALDRAGWNAPAHIVGSSYGGVVALELALRGRAVSVLALAPPWTAGLGVAYYAALFLPSRGMPLLDPLFRIKPAWPLGDSLLFHQSRLPLALDPEDAEEMWRSIGHFPFLRVGIASRGRGPGLPDLERLALATAGTPTTLVWGTRDPFVPAWMRRRWEDALPAARTRQLPGFPHQPHLRDPALVAELALADASPSP